MRILLLRSKFQGNFDEFTAPPLGLAYLAAVLEKEKHNVKILDGWIHNLDILVPKIIESFKPDLIGVTGLTVNIISTFKLVDKLKGLAPKTPLIFGGPHASMDPKGTLENVNSIDIVCIGEGEKTILDIIKYLKRKKNLKNIKGIYYREKGKIKSTGPRELIKNLDEIPMPARHLLPIESYTPSPKEHKMLPGTDIITSRGCPYQCAFCFKQVFGQVYRTNSPEYVVKEIKSLIKAYGVKDLFFRDDTFTVDRERVMKICELIKKEKINITFATLSRVDRLDFEILKTMKEAGCWKILFGIESGNQKSLDLLRKGIKLDEVRKVIGYCKKLGIEADGFFILGIPGENKKDTVNTIEFAKKLKLDFAQFYICTPYPGTYLYELAKKYGVLNIKENEWEKFNQFGDNEPLFIPNGWTARQLKKYQTKAWREFYFRPSYILNRAKKLKSFEELKNNFLGAVKILQTFK